MTDMKISKVLAERERIMIQERELNKRLAELKEERKPFDIEIDHFLGHKDEIRLSKWIIKRVARDSYEVRASSYVSIRVNKIRLVAKSAV